jgi:SAM-dependent methyltransferase
MKINPTDYLRYVGQMLDGSRAKIERGIAERRDRDIGPYVRDTSDLRILDLANGSLQPQYTILKAAGHQVCGIDLLNRPRLNWTDLAYRVARRIFTWRLSVRASALKPKTLVCGTVTELPFRNDSFDLVTSIAAFEHFLNVPAVVAELHRVLRPGGLAWIGVHLFSSLSGGHNFNLSEVPLRTIPSGIEPWDHLRKRRVKFRVPLNEWRREQYVQLVGSRFKILNQYCVMREGEEFLSPSIEAELKHYSRDELTCRSYIILAQKTSGS